jgi:hypothetical protein
VLAAFSAAGILLAIKVSRIPWVASRTGILEFVGRDSVVFYCSHFPVLILIVILGKALGLPVGVVIPLGFAVAILVGTLLLLGARTRAFAWLFVAPFGSTVSTASPGVFSIPVLATRSSTTSVAVAQTAMSAVALAAMVFAALRWL